MVRRWLGEDRRQKFDLIDNRGVTVEENQLLAPKAAVTAVGSIPYFAEKLLCTNFDILLFGGVNQFLQPAFMLVASHTLAKSLSLKLEPL